MYKLPDPQQPVQIVIRALYAIVLLLLVLLVGIHQMTNISFASFTADPATVFGYNPLYGYISNLGVILWGACMSVCLFSALILNSRRDQSKMIAFFISFGALTAVLMLDDLFMFHEKLAPEYLNISEKWVLLTYALYAAGSIYHFRDILFTHDMKFFIISFAAFASSVLLDQIATRYYFPGEFLFEDGLKFIGIASWLTYFLNMASTHIMALMTSNMALQEPSRRKKLLLERFSHN